MPRISDPGSMIAELFAAGESGGCFVSRCQDDAVYFRMAAVAQMDPSAMLVVDHIDGLGVDKIGPYQGGFTGRLQVDVHQRAEIVAEDHPRNESLAEFGVGYRVVFASGAEPL